MSVPQPKLHSALTADEAREAIILDFSNQLRSKLISAGLEGSHTTFVNAEWVGGVRVKAFLRKPIDVKVVGSTGEEGASDEQLEASASIGRQVKNPEMVRGELHAGPYEMKPVSEVFPGEEASGLPPTTGIVKGFTDEPQQVEVSDSEFPLTDVVEKREAEHAHTDSNASTNVSNLVHDARNGVDVVPASEMDGGGYEGNASTASATEAPFILSRSESHSVDLSEIQSEIDLTRVTVVNEHEEVSVIDPASLCQFCSTPLSTYPAPKMSHMRTHVRKGEAIEFTDGNGEKAWRRNE